MSLADPRVRSLGTRGVSAPNEVCSLSTTRLRNPPSRDGRFSSELRFMLLRRGPLWPYPPFKYPNEGAHRKQSGIWQSGIWQVGPAASEFALLLRYQYFANVH